MFSRNFDPTAQNQTQRVSPVRRSECEVIVSGRSKKSASLRSIQRTNMKFSPPV